MQTLKSIAHSIYGICFDVDNRITGLSEADASLWAKTNALRHAHTIKVIINYVKANNKKNLKILNASGISCGHQDFSIVSYLHKNTSMTIEWTVFDSPNNKFLDNGLFKKYLNDLQIKLNLADFSVESKLYGAEEKIYDVVLFTEIAEHLDYSTLIKTLITVRRKMRNDGMVIITTPNLVSFENRIRILFGSGDGPYWGDGMQNFEKGLYGHIVNYDLRRMKRLLADIGYSVNSAYTFTPGHGSREKYLVRRLMYKLVYTFSLFTRNSRTILLIVASKATPEQIPYEV